MPKTYYYEDFDQTEFEKALEEAKKQMSETNKKFAQAMQEIKKIWKNQAQEYKALINAVKTNKIDFTHLFDDGYTEEKEHITNKYNLLRKGIESDKSLTDEQKEYFHSSFDYLEDEEKEGAYENSLLGKTGKKVSSEFSSGLQDMIKGYKDFSDVMEEMTASLTDYMIKQFTDKLMQNVFSENTMNIVSSLFGSFFNWGGGAAKSALGFIGSLFTKHHSGGIVPSGANYSLPGTDEQLALLKGGERVLSPSENVSYERGQEASPVIVNSFNVKAWDSKDVSRYLLDNKQLLNQITYEGIKDNCSHLRTMVQNA